MAVERSKGFEAVHFTILFVIIRLPSMTLDSGIYARMTCLKIKRTFTWN